MKWLNQLLNILYKPFPEQEGNFGAPKTTFLISLFITFFLYTFEPFGIETLESNKFWICLGFGSMTFLGALFYESTNAEVIRSATEIPATWMGRKTGKVSPGYKANLLLLDANPLDKISNTKRINSVILNGKVFDRNTLNEMLESVKSANDRSRKINIDKYGPSNGFIAEE